MKGISAALTGVATGVIGGVGAFNVEMGAIMLSLAASSIVITASFMIYCTREWQARVAITPLFAGSIIYLSYAFILEPSISADYMCQLIDSVGIITIVIYTIWNRRKRHAPKEAHKTQSAKEKEHPTQEKMRAIR